MVKHFPLHVLLGELTWGKLKTTFLMGFSCKIDETFKALKLPF